MTTAIFPKGKCSLKERKKSSRRKETNNFNIIEPLKKCSMSVILAVPGVCIFIMLLWQMLRSSYIILCSFRLWQFSCGPYESVVQKILLGAHPELCTCSLVCLGIADLIEIYIGLSLLAEPHYPTVFLWNILQLIIPNTSELSVGIDITCILALRLPFLPCVWRGMPDKHMDRSRLIESSYAYSF